MKMRYRAGDVLFREGDPSDFACLILEGAVEVRRNVGGESVLLGELGVGDLAGEMGVLENQQRSATVIAQGDVAVDVIPADGFIERIVADPGVAGHLLRRQSSRVRSLTAEVSRLYEALRRIDPQAAVERRPAQAQTPPSAPALPALVVAPKPEGNRPPRITLRCLGAAGDALIVAPRLPYRVGRQAPHAGQFGGDEQTLALPDNFPFRLSVNHFAIVEDEKLGPAVRDLGSDLGTTVNGQFLGGIFARDTSRLQDGVNSVVAGGLDSPFVFKVLVE